MRLLVTGCAGFICSSVTELLLADGHSVVGVDSLENSYDVSLKRWRLEGLEKAPDFEFYPLDITDQQAITGVMEKGPFDGVVNLAARAGVRQSLENPRAYYETNVTGTLNLLEACRNNGEARPFGQNHQRISLLNGVIRVVPTFHGCLQCSQLWHGHRVIGPHFCALLSKPVNYSQCHGVA